MYELHQALGQYLFYSTALSIKKEDRVMYLAMPSEIYFRLKKREVFLQTIELYQVKLIIFNPETKTIESWKQE